MPPKVTRPTARRFIARTTLLLAAALGIARDARPQPPIGAPAGMPAGMPHLRTQGAATQLVVDGAPFLIRGGELGNSTASDPVALRPHWARLRALHLNTVLAPVYWELLEPTEGTFDFALVDGLIADARRHDLRLVLLWFGSWKNSMSAYAPAWVKTNQPRFPRTEATRGHGQEILSPFHAANWDADARAFAALMRHLRAVDGTRHTVLMVQVENETGMIPEARDHSPTADSLFAQPVPAPLIDYLRRHHATLAPVVLAHQGRGTMTAVLPTVSIEGAVDDAPQRVKLAGAPYTLTVTFAADGATDPIAGILSADAGRYVDGRWVRGLRMNGDQTHQGRHVALGPGDVGMQRVRLYRYH